MMWNHLLAEYGCSADADDRDVRSGGPMCPQLAMIGLLIDRGWLLNGRCTQQPAGLLLNSPLFETQSHQSGTGHDQRDLISCSRLE